MENQKNGHLVRLAHTIENCWDAYGSQALQPILGIALLYLGSDLPELREHFRKLEAHDFISTCISYRSVKITLFISIMFIISTVVNIRRDKQQRKHIEKLESNSSKAHTDVTALRQKLDDAEQHGEYLRIEYYKLLQRGASALLGRIIKKHPNSGDHLRASLYAHVGSQFILAGRYTEHPNHCTPNRQLFPDGQGCIGKAWVDGGECYAALEAQNDQWLKDQATYDVDSETATLLRMKSQEYYTKALSDGRMRVGVIVFESTQAAVLDVELLRGEVAETEDNLVLIIEQAKFLNPFITMQNMGGYNE